MAWSTTIDNGVATLTLEQPPLNILTRAVLAELREALSDLTAETALRVLRLTAVGKHFSAGADVGEHLPPLHDVLIPEFASTVEKLAAFPLPVVAAVRGRCLGGGFELAQACDVVVAAEDALFGQPEILLGVTAPAACVLLPRRGPYGAAAELLFTGEPVSAPRALALGWVQRVVPAVNVEDEALALARSIARHSGAALRQVKRTMLETAALPRSQALAHAAHVYVRELMETHDALEGLKAFLEKRLPVWRHA